MADRSVASSNTFEVFRTTFNSLSADVGDIAVSYTHLRAHETV